jgi:hypothetical protein
LALTCSYALAQPVDESWAIRKSKYSDGPLVRISQTTSSWSDLREGACSEASHDQRLYSSLFVCSLLQTVVTINSTLVFHQSAVWSRNHFDEIPNSTRAT